MVLGQAAIEVWLESQSARGSCLGRPRVDSQWEGGRRNGQLALLNSTPQVMGQVFLAEPC